MAAASVCVPRVSPNCLLLLWDKQVGLTQAPFKLLLLPWVPESVRLLCTPFKSGVSFPQPSGSSKRKPHWPSKPNVLGAHLPSAEPLGREVQCGAWTPHSLGRTSAIVIILQFVGHLWGWGLWAAGADISEGTH